MEKWQELMTLNSLAESWSLVKGFFDDTEFSIEDVLNGNEAAFEAFKTAYIAALKDMGANDANYLDGVDKYAGAYDKIADKSKTATDAMKNVATESDKAAKSASDLGTASETASTNVGTLATSSKDLSDGLNSIDNDNLSSLVENLSKLPATAGDGLKDIATGLSELASSLGEGSALATAVESITQALCGEDGNGGIVGALAKLSNGEGVDVSKLVTQFGALSTAVKNVSAALGLNSEGADIGGLMKGTPNAQGGTPLESMGQSSGSLISSLNALNGITFTNLIAQFTLLKDAIASVAAAIGGGGKEGESAESSITSALENLATITGTTVGGMGEGTGGNSNNSTSTEAPAEDSTVEGGGTVIGAFSQLKKKVDDVSTAIGTDKSEEGSADLIGAENALQIKTEEYIGNPESKAGDGTVIGNFIALDEVLAEASDHVNSMKQSIEDMANGSPWKVEIEVEVRKTGAFTGTALVDSVIPPNSAVKSIRGSLPNDSALHSGHYEAMFGHAHVEGTAKLSGDWGAKHGGRTLVGELGQELIVRNGRFFTVGDHGAEFVNINPGDVIFNHLQTRELLEKGRLLGGGATNLRGQALAGGTLPQGFSPLSADESKLYNLFSGIESNTDIMARGLDMISKSVASMDNSLQKVVSTKTVNNSPVINVTNPQFTCTGVTGEQVLHEIESQFSGLFLNAYQKSMSK